MVKYGACQRKPPEGDIVWFLTEQPITPGAYRLGAAGRSEPNVYVAESVAALILMAYPMIHAVEAAGQKRLSTPGLSKQAAERVAMALTEDLVRRLTEDDTIWVDEPTWVRNLKPADSGQD